MKEGHIPLRQKLVAVGVLLLSMVSVTSGAAIAKGLFPQIGAEGITALRNGFGALILVVLWRPWRGGKLSRQQLKPLLAYGLCLGLMNLFFYMSLKTLPLGLAVAIEFTGPFSVALFQSRRTVDLLWLLLAIAGLALLIPWGSGPIAADPQGVVLSLAAGAMWAVYIVFGQKAARLMSGGRVTSLGLCIGALTALPVGIGVAGGALLAVPTLLAGFGVAIFSSAIPYSLDMVALKRLPSRVFGILMSLEPAVAAMSGWIWLGEGLSLRQDVAMGCVMLASLGSTVLARKGGAAPHGHDEVIETAE